MESIPFGTLPHPVSPPASLTPFTISIPDHELERLNLLLKHSTIARPNIWNSGEGGSLGISREKLVNLVEHWKNVYDWRKWESVLNSIPQYKITLSDDDSKSYEIHFFGLFSTNASAIPVVLLHGWPGSMVEFLPILLKLRSQYEPSSLPYHIIVPHYVGFPFSSAPPLNREFTHLDNARLITRMVHALGFSESGYVVQGGDLGSATATAIASVDPACKLVHVNLLQIPPPAGVDIEADIRAGKYTPEEIISLNNTAEFLKTGTAFIMVDGHEPSTAGLLIGSNPVALLTWIGGKMVEWSDETPDVDLILTNVALYWFTGCYSTSIGHHRLIAGGNFEPLTGGWKTVEVPLGYSWFRKEISNPPKVWIDQTGKVSWYRTHSKGGHFPALEKPEELWKDVEDFIAEFWSKAA
ncbi:hypothetical protein TruAng_009870 [Truncatella angustata]|nr:hypothetical protein TruAng_009870 [Truncatella angustata]